MADADAQRVAPKGVLPLRVDHELETPETQGPHTWWELFAARWGLNGRDVFVFVLVVAALVHMTMTFIYGAGTQEALSGFWFQFCVTGFAMSYMMARAR